MSESDELYVECGDHGQQQATYVCRHIAQSLIDHKPTGFLAAEQSADNLRPDAWCSACEEMVNRTGEWDEESEAFAGVKLLCGACYDDAKLMNHSV